MELQAPGDPVALGDGSNGFSAIEMLKTRARFQGGITSARPLSLGNLIVKLLSGASLWRCYYLQSVPLNSKLFL